MRRLLPGVAVLTCAASLAISSHAAPPQPDPVSKVIAYGNKPNIGTLKITDYATYTTTNGRVGAKIEAQFTQTDLTSNYRLQWIQSIYDGKGTKGQDAGSTLPYLDLYSRNDNLPYYWTARQNAEVGTGKLDAASNPGSLFSDDPFESPPIVGDFIKFEAALVATDNYKLVWLAGFTWGYQQNPGGTSSLYDFNWLTAPTAKLTAPTIAWDGTDNPKGGGDPVGYQFVPAPVPEPGSLVLAVFAVAGATLVVRRQKHLHGA